MKQTPAGGLAASEKDVEKNQPLEGYADIKQAADILNVSTKTIRRYIQSDRLHAEKIRNVWLISESEITRLREDTVQEPAAVPGAAPREFVDALERIQDRLNAIEIRLGDLSPDINQDLDEAQSRATQLEDENQALREEISDLKQELAKVRSENVHDPQAGKARAEEIDALRATIVSNERGLALLREEVQHKDTIVREKEQEIIQLLDKLKEMENLYKPVKSPQVKPRLWGSFKKNGPSQNSRF